MNILFTILVMLALFASIRVMTAAVEKLGTRRSISPYRIKYTIKTISLAFMAFYLVLLITFLGIQYSQIFVFLSSVFAVIGIALFAQWSILSNITASLIIFFGFPYRVGDQIRVLDKDGDISGRIEEISMFHVLIKQGEDLITYPNTMILQKAVVKLPAGSSSTPEATSQTAAD